MARVQFTEEAAADLREIWNYLDDQNPDAADRLVGQLDEQCILLAEYPKIGRMRPDIASGLRYFPVKKYLILYRELPDGIEVVRVIHGSRNLQALFDLDGEK